MVSNKWLSWIKGNDKVIIQLLEEQSSNLVMATDHLVELVLESHNQNVCEEKVSLIKKLEQLSGVRWQVAC